MSGAKKAWKNIKSDTRGFIEKPWTTMDAKTVIEKGGSRVVETFTPEIPTPEDPVIIPIPDENTATLEAKRRRSRAPKTGRDSTILTEGLGG